MPGFFGIVSCGKKLDQKLVEVMKIECLSNVTTIEKSIASSNYFFGLKALKKFENDKFFERYENKIYCLDGVIINRKELLSKYRAENLLDLFIKSDFVEMSKNLRGEFAGFVYDAEKNRLILATDHVSSKPVFYTLKQSYFIFGTEFRYVIRLMKILNIPLKLSEIGVLSLLEFGYMLENHTLLEDVYKLKAGSALIFDGNTSTYTIQKYFDSAVEPKLESKEKVLRELNNIFSEAVRLQWAKDEEYGYSHLATLSGGLDSRTNILMAKKMGFRDISVITFSESDYWDEKIAKKISRDNGFNFIFRALDNGNYLIDIEKYVKANGGLTVYCGAAHTFSTLGILNMEMFGILHTGQLGDAILGTYLGKDLKSERLNQILEEAKRKYENLEKFILYNRGYNAILNGNWNAQHFTEMISPFLFPEFIELCLRIPDEYKRNERIYIEWLKKYLPESYNYSWESLKGLKPSSP